MRVVIQTIPGVVELNWIWLPLCISCNKPLLMQLEQELGPLIKGKELTDETLDEIHTQAIEFLSDKFPVDGLAQYLDGLKFLQVKHEAGTPSP